MQPWGRRRSLLALGVSLGLHACVVFFWSARQPVAPPRRVELPLPEVQWFETATVDPRVREVTLVAPVDPIERATPDARAPATASPTARATPDARALATAPPTAAVTPDAPRATAGAGVARSGVALEGSMLSPSGDLPAVVERPRGVTLHPADPPSDAELRADEQARVEARVGGWLKTDLARARATNGLPDPAYGALGAALRAATDDVPQLIDTNSPREVRQAFVESWLAGAERYGKSGAPYAEPEGQLEVVERPSSLASEAARGSPDAINLVNFLAAGARMQEFADGRAGLELFALVEVRQASSGVVESVVMISPSGLKPFDAWVTRQANEVAVSFSFDAGTRGRPLRSVWRFDGIMRFRRKLKPDQLDGRAVLGMMTMAALSALSSFGNEFKPDPSAPMGTGRPLGPRVPALVGRFDELSGELDLVDFTNPTYDCKVTLLEAD